MKSPVKLILFDSNTVFKGQIHAELCTIQEVFRAFGKAPPTSEKYWEELYNAGGDENAVFKKHKIFASKENRETLFLDFIPRYLDAYLKLPTTVLEILFELQQAKVVCGFWAPYEGDFMENILKKQFRLKFKEKPHLENPKHPYVFDYVTFGGTVKEAILYMLQIENMSPKKVGRSECVFVSRSPAHIANVLTTGVHPLLYRSKYIPDWFVEFHKIKKENYIYFLMELLIRCGLYEDED